MKDQNLYCIVKYQADDVFTCSVKKFAALTKNHTRHKSPNEKRSRLRASEVSSALKLRIYSTSIKLHIQRKRIISKRSIWRAIPHVA